LLRLTTDEYKASRGLSVTTELLVSYHRLRGSASIVLSAIGQVNDTANVDPLQNRNRLADCQEIRQNWLCQWGNPLNQIWYKSIHLGLWASGWNVTFFVPCLFIHCF